MNNLWTEEGLGDMLNPKPDIESKEARKKTKDGAGKSSGLQKHEDIKMIAKSGTSSQRRLGKFPHVLTTCLKRGNYWNWGQNRICRQPFP